MKRALVAMAFVVAASALMLAGCTSKTPKAEFDLDEGWVTVEGKTLTVALNGNPDAGFNWIFTNQSDSMLLKETSYQANEIDNSETSEEDNGASDDSNVSNASEGDSDSSTYTGVHTFVIEGTTAGDGIFTLEYVLHNASNVFVSYSFKVSTDNDGTIKSVEVSKNGELVSGAIIA